MISDERIIGRVLKGDREEYRELIRRHQNSVFYLAYRILGRREEAEDVVQETYICAFSNLAKCRDRNKFSAWIKRIAINICLKRLPRELPCITVDEMLESASDLDNSVETEVLRQVEINDVRDIVSDLSVEFRTVIVLRYDENLSYNEIAKLIGESVDVVRVRLYRAKKILAVRLAVVKSEV